MKIILEGPDCSGKTTLAKGMYSSHQYNHFGPPHENAFDEYLEHIAQMHRDDANMRNRIPIDVVIDRFIYGERIYGPLFRDDLSYTGAHLRMLERLMFGFPSVVIWCQTDWDITHGIWAERHLDEMVKKKEQFRKIWEAYRTLRTDVSLPCVDYDFTKDTPNTLAYRLQNLKGELFRNKGPGIGNFRDGVTLLVGDKINTNVSGYEYPFVADSGSSLWLAEQLEEWGVNEKDLYWINSIGINEQPTPGEFLRYIKPRLVVALGKAAEIWCKQNSIKVYETVPHPQFWKRFHAKEEYPLAQLLYVPHTELQPHQHALPNGAEGRSGAGDSFYPKG